jgi:hypothetical protein
MIGEILWRNGKSLEFGFEDRLDFRQRIEPWEKGPAVFTRPQALIELLSD